MLSSETNPACLRVLSHRFPKLKHLGDVAKITAAMLASAIADVAADVIVLGFGSPCNQISCAGNGDGLEGKDSRKFFWALDVIDALIGLSDEKNMKLIIFFEMVVPASINVVHRITYKLGCDIPILFDAADFGWTTRKRLIWSSVPLAPIFQPFLHAEGGKPWKVFTVPRAQQMLPALGSIFRSNYHPRWLSKSATADHPEGRFPVITNRLQGISPHDAATASPDARARCRKLGSVWPYYWHEDSALLWCCLANGTWDVSLPDVGEAERLMGLPPDHTAVPRFLSSFYLL